MRFFPNVLRTCSVRAPYVLRSCSVRGRCCRLASQYPNIFVDINVYGYVYMYETVAIGSRHSVAEGTALNICAVALPNLFAHKVALTRDASMITWRPTWRHCRSLGLCFLFVEGARVRCFVRNKNILCLKRKNA